MDELGNWVYIILMVVVAISSLYKSANKKKEQQQTQIPEPPKQFYPEPTVPKKKSKKLPPLIPGHSRTQPATSFLTSSTIKKENITNELSITSEEENVLVEELELPNNINEWRKAFIYNEIFSCKN